MAVVGFSFTKILVEKNDQQQGKTVVNHHIRILDLVEVPLALGSATEKGLRFNFAFHVDYNPNFGKIHLEGYMLYMAKPEEKQKLLDTWKKDKKVDKELETFLLRQALEKSTIQAVLMAKEINLPAPVPLTPKIIPRDQKK